MPRKALKPCKHPGCPRLTEGAYCDEHKPLHPDRPSAAKRGYGSKWQRVSKAYLRKHPMCVKCLAQGKFVTATVVDHIVPHRSDHYLMWSDTNWQALYGIWQHSEKGKVAGISGNVDLDIGYKDFPTIIKGKGLNGYGAEPVLPNPPAPAAEDGITVEVTVDGKKYSGRAQNRAA